MKAIQILSHSTRARDEKSIKSNITGGWHARLGQAIEQYSEFDVECWIPEYGTNIQQTIKEDGVTYRLFPSFRMPTIWFDGLRPYIPDRTVEFPLSMIQQMWSMDRDNVIFHLHGSRSILSYLSGLLFHERNLVLHDHGGMSSTPSVEQLSYTGYDHIYTITEIKQNHIVETVGISSNKVSVESMGVDTDIYKPHSLSVSNNRPSLLFVGSYNDAKGLGLILDVFEDIREEFGAELRLLGGSTDDSLYERAASMPNVHVETEWISDPITMAREYTAADVYVSFPTDNEVLAGGGGLIAPVEAMSCNTPVVSSVAQFFPESIQGEAAKHVSTKDELHNAIRLILQRESNSVNCRDHVVDHFSWESKSRKISQKYRHII